MRVYDPHRMDYSDLQQHPEVTFYPYEDFHENHALDGKSPFYFNDPEDKPLLVVLSK